jgi:alpha-beta hydrolase superfamily lysophospholipase
MEPSSTGTISGLYTESFRPEAAPLGTVLITHGFAEHCGRYREVAHAIVRAGWAVLSYDVRGHGRSPGQRGYIDRFTTYLTDLAAMQDAASALAGAGTPLVLLGHSHGGLITLRALAGDQPPRVAAAIVSSPFLGLKLKLPAWQWMLASVATRLAPRLSQPNPLRVEYLTRDPQKQAERTADPLCFSVATPRWFTEALAAQQYVLEHADRIRLPTTWLVAGDDPIADPATSRKVGDRVAGARYHELPGLRHEIFNEVERGQVFDELTRALAAVRAPRASVSGA